MPTLELDDPLEKQKAVALPEALPDTMPNQLKDLIGDYYSEEPAAVLTRYVYNALPQEFPDILKSLIVDYYNTIIFTAGYLAQNSANPQIIKMAIDHFLETPTEKERPDVVDQLRKDLDRICRINGCKITQHDFETTEALKSEIGKKLGPDSGSAVEALCTEHHQGIGYILTLIIQTAIYPEGVDMPPFSAALDPETVNWNYLIVDNKLVLVCSAAIDDLIFVSEEGVKQRCPDKSKNGESFKIMTQTFAEYNQVVKAFKIEYFLLSPNSVPAQDLIADIFMGTLSGLDKYINPIIFLGSLFNLDKIPVKIPIEAIATQKEIQQLFRYYTINIHKLSRDILTIGNMIARDKKQSKESKSVDTLENNQIILDQLLETETCIKGLHDKLRQNIYEKLLAQAKEEQKKQHKDKRNQRHKQIQGKKSLSMAQTDLGEIATQLRHEQKKAQVQPPSPAFGTGSLLSLFSPTRYAPAANASMSALAVASTISGGSSTSPKPTQTPTHKRRNQRPASMGQNDLDIIVAQATLAQTTGNLPTSRSYSNAQTSIGSAIFSPPRPLQSQSIFSPPKAHRPPSMFPLTEDSSIDEEDSSRLIPSVLMLTSSTFSASTAATESTTIGVT